MATDAYLAEKMSALSEVKYAFDRMDDWMREHADGEGERLWLQYLQAQVRLLEPSD